MILLYPSLASFNKLYLFCKKLRFVLILFAFLEYYGITIPALTIAFSLSLSIIEDLSTQWLSIRLINNYLNALWILDSAGRVVTKQWVDQRASKNKVYLKRLEF